MALRNSSGLTGSYPPPLITYFVQSVCDSNSGRFSVSTPYLASKLVRQRRYSREMKYGAESMRSKVRHKPRFLTDCRTLSSIRATKDMSDIRFIQNRNLVLTQPDI